MNKKLAIIGSGEAALIIADEAKKMEIETHSFSNNSHDRVCGHSTYHHIVDIFDINKIVEICQQNDVSGVIATTELTISIAAKVSSILGLTGMDVSVAEMITDKGYVRDKLHNLKIIKQPWYKIWNIGESLPKIDSFPVVVKPTALGGKRGVTVVKYKDSFADAIDYSVNNMPQNKQRVIIEEYIGGGQEYSVESMSFNGKHRVIQVTEKITSGPPHCVELGHMQPANLSDEIRTKIEWGIEELLEALEVDNTVSHTEVKVVNDEIFLIELNARSGGDHIAYPLTHLSTGYPFIQGAINIAMGDCILPDTKILEKNVCGVIFVVKQTERFKSLFDTCENYGWLYKKNKTTEELLEIVNNHSFDTNYFIFKSDSHQIPEEIKCLL